ncbi:MAG TPA: response regulator [Burkholderiales bacterium]|jgi:DNA-binding NarL/FixJ family response regulator|nr:response regulator [Burkholderiales bacterium]
MQAQASPAAPVRVFVVEDSERIRQRLDTLIAEAGAENAGHAEEVGPATRAILETRPDVVILDLQLADGTGFDVLRAVHDAAPEIDVYLFTNFAADPYRQLAERLGARGFIDKSKEFERVHDLLVQRRNVTCH